ncbi:MAG: tetratricopeptide repeat protein [Gemmataceae bacterium]
MSKVDRPEILPEATLVTSAAEEATILLEQACKLGKTTPELAYMLAMAYKRQNKMREAREALRKIAPPDANVMLQMGLISFHERHFQEAEKEFLRATELNPQSYAAFYNLLLTRLCLGQLEEGEGLLTDLLSLSPSAEEERFLTLVGALLKKGAASPEPPVGSTPPPLPVDFGPEGEANVALANMGENEEDRLLELIHSIGRFEAIYPMLRALAAARPHSTLVQRTHLELVMIQASRHVQKCEWVEAASLIKPLSRMVEVDPNLRQSVSDDLRGAFMSLEGVCAAMLQNYETAIRCFSRGLQLIGNNHWLHQNLAICYEMMKRMDKAELHWNRYFDLLDYNVPVPPDASPEEYLDDLAYAGLTRLADIYYRDEKWDNAVGYLQRAVRLRPRDLDTLERLFHLYVQVRRSEDARRLLRKMRDLSPDDPQLELYELDLREPRSLKDLERMIADIKRILGRYPDDLRVEERALVMVSNCITIVSKECDRLTEKLAHIVDQVKRLPNYQVNWPVVRDEMHYLRQEFQQLKRLSNKCLNLINSDEHRRIIRELNDHIDSKIDICISMGG